MKDASPVEGDADRRARRRAAESGIRHNSRSQKWMAFSEEFKTSGWSASVQRLDGSMRARVRTGRATRPSRRQAGSKSSVVVVQIDEIPFSAIACGTRIGAAAKIPYSSWGMDDDFRKPSFISS